MRLIKNKKKKIGKIKKLQGGGAQYQGGKPNFGSFVWLRGRRFFSKKHAQKNQTAQRIDHLMKQQGRVTTNIPKPVPG